MSSSSLEQGRYREYVYKKWLRRCFTYVVHVEVEDIDGIYCEEEGGAVSTRDKYSLYTHRDMRRGGPELWRAFVLRIRSLSLCLSFPARYCRFISKRASFCLSYTRLCFKLTLLSWGILRIFQPSPFKKLFPPNFSSPCSYQFFSGYITIRTWWPTMWGKGQSLWGQQQQTQRGEWGRGKALSTPFFLRPICFVFI